MWTVDNRERYNRDKLRYPGDLADGEWSMIAPMIAPMIPPGRRGGRKRPVDLRQVTNGIMYVLSTGCQWRYLPKDLPLRIHFRLFSLCRDKIERESSPTDCLIDSQSVKSAEKGGPKLTRMAMMAASRDKQAVALKSKARSVIYL